MRMKLLSAFERNRTSARRRQPSSTSGFYAPVFGAREVETMIDFILVPPGLSRQKQGFRTPYGAPLQNQRLICCRLFSGASLVSTFLTSDQSRHFEASEPNMI